MDLASTICGGFLRVTTRLVLADELFHGTPADLAERLPHNSDDMKDTWLKFRNHLPIQHLSPASTILNLIRPLNLVRGTNRSSVGILSSNLVSGAAQNTQSCQNTPSAFHQITAEFQQLGQDLQTGNVTAAQSDFTTLSKNLSTIL
jgi:hypothetical protein